MILGRHSMGNVTRKQGDFQITNRGANVGIDRVIKATAVDPAQVKPSEWNNPFSAVALKVLKRFKQLNTEAIIHGSNAMLSKTKNIEILTDIGLSIPTKPALRLI